MTGSEREPIHPRRTEWLVFDAEAVGHVDTAGLAAIEQLVDHLRADGITLVVARMKAPIRDRFDAASLTAKIGADRFYPTVRAAVAAVAEARTPQPA
jgi:MFS superfamily sulfate permease-like transporter